MRRETVNEVLEEAIDVLSELAKDLDLLTPKTDDEKDILGERKTESN